jgi:hypothetical protein
MDVNSGIFVIVTIIRFNLTIMAMHVITQIKVVPAPICGGNEFGEGQFAMHTSEFRKAVKRTTVWRNVANSLQPMDNFMFSSCNSHTASMVQ